MNFIGLYRALLKCSRVNTCSPNGARVWLTLLDTGIRNEIIHMDSLLMCAVSNTLLTKTSLVAFCRRSVGIALLVTAQLSMGQNTDVSAMHAADLKLRYPGGSILTVNAAVQALTDALAMRGQIEVQFSLEEKGCYPVFFVASCLDGAKERRRAALSVIRSVEIEADIFTRRLRVQERDKALAERREVLVAEAPQRAKDQLQNEVNAAQKASNSAQKLKARQDSDSDSVNAMNADKRVAKHAERMRTTQAKALADAPALAANEAAYAKKAIDAEMRQREIVASKIEKKQARLINNAAP